MVADCVSAANSTPSGPNVSGPIDLNAGPVAAAARSAAGTPDQDTSTVRTNADFRISDRIPVTPFPGPPRAVVSLNTEARMRRLPVLAAFLVFQAMTMAQQPAGQPAPSPPAPKAPKMASDEVMALLEKGQVFFLDVREPSEPELGRRIGKDDAHPRSAAAVQRSLYALPRGMERFREYIRTMTDAETGDLALHWWR